MGAMACARLLRVLFIAFGTAIGNYRCCRPLVKGFKNWFHTKYNHAQDPCEYFQNNWKPIVSKLSVAGGLYALKNVFTIDWIQEDISGYLHYFGFDDLGFCKIYHQHVQSSDSHNIRKYGTTR